MKLRSALSIAGLLLAAIGATSAQADTDGPWHGPTAIAPDAIEFSANSNAPNARWLPAHDAPRTTRLRGPAIDGPGPMQLRWGVDLHRAGGDAVHPFLGLGLAAGRSTTLYYEQGMPQNPAALSSRPPLAGDARLGLEFRTGSKNPAWREIGTLRMQIDVNTRLSLKPRRGGATISYHKQF